MNRGTILFPDSFPYVTSGNKVWSTLSKFAAPGEKANGEPKPQSVAGPSPKSEKATAVSGRSPYYGVFAAAASKLSSFSAIAVMQALWASIVLLMAFRVFGIGGWQRPLIVGLLAAFSSLAFFTTVLMPDVFAGISVLSMAILVFYGRSMSRAELAFWSLNLLVTTLFHMAFFVTTTGTMIVIFLLFRRRRDIMMLWPAAILAAVLVGTLSIGYLASHLSERRVSSIPFLLARTVGDGTAERVLSEDCPRIHYATCHFVPAFPIAEIDFLWNSSIVTPWARMTNAERDAVSREQNAILVQVLRRYPVEQAVASIGNTIRQLVKTDLTKFARRDYVWPSIDREFPGELATYRQTSIWAGQFPLAGLTWFWFTLYAASGVAAVMLFLGRKRLMPSLDPRKAAVVATLLTALLVSAATTGALAGVIGRYQARLSWVAVLALIVLVHHLYQMRRHTQPIAVGPSGALA